MPIINICNVAMVNIDIIRHFFFIATTGYGSRGPFWLQIHKILIEKTIKRKIIKPYKLFIYRTYRD